MTDSPQTDPPPAECLAATDILDSDHPEVAALAAATVSLTRHDSATRAVKLYYRVRDGIRYDPYTPFFLPEHYRASAVLKRGRGFCVPKAALLCALSRAAGVPARVGFATVRNHLATRQLLDFIGSDLFVYHGYVEFHLNGRWVKATPAFNRTLCLRHDVPPLDFDGRQDSVFQPYNLKNNRFMEYVEDHGTFADIPVALIVDAWRRAYGKHRVEGWVAAFRRTKADSIRDFYAETVIGKPAADTTARDGRLSNAG
jgi:transglutaminase-like putative cysteine protease